MDPVNTIDFKLLLNDPLIKHISELVTETTGYPLLIVHPDGSGWREVHGGTVASPKPDFCRLIGSGKDGAKHCRMCHVLMSVAACGGGPVEQTCHAGTTVLVFPVADSESGATAILSACHFSSDDGWATVEEKGKRLGLDLKALRAVYDRLPRLNGETYSHITMAMKIMRDAIYALQREAILKEQLAQTRHTEALPETLEKHFNDISWALQKGSKDAPGDEDSQMPLILRVVCELIAQRPDLPLTVKELAAAARLTPNHFTTLFRTHVGRSFTDHLLDERIGRAKRLLRNPTLQINEVARLVGYDDPGYFARRFRQRTGKNPKAWRRNVVPEEPESVDS